MRRAALWAVAILAAAGVAPAQAQTQGGGDAAQGRALAEERNCGACHGPAGISAMPNIPS
ncbi:MAG: hypothetical protein JWP04_2396, partial [Belnapia sp.]|nr:hypothetical protein [Belnapia sp.]